MATLQVKKRRMFDITRSLIGAGFIEKISKNRIQWKAAGFPISSIQEQIRTMKIEESILEERIREMKERLRNLREDKNNKR
ncbi:transcription factor E2FB-like [Primulina eburnea]|uniref:transcription factor E2FB-like n=1 Tax=Primulina eburnea TaxID=1245227 RepID=UPI003C6CA81E